MQIHFINLSIEFPFLSVVCTTGKNTKKVLDNIKLELPDVPDINDIKIIKLNREKVENEIIKPKDKLINELYQDNKNLYRELSKQVNLVDKATKYEKERKRIMYDNEELHNEVDKIKLEYKQKEFDLEWEYQSQIKGLEKENKHLHKVVDKFKDGNLNVKQLKDLCYIISGISGNSSFISSNTFLVFSKLVSFFKSSIFSCFAPVCSTSIPLSNSNPFEII